MSFAMTSFGEGGGGSNNNDDNVKPNWDERYQDDSSDTTVRIWSKVTAAASAGAKGTKSIPEQIEDAMELLPIEEKASYLRALAASMIQPIPDNINTRGATGKPNQVVPETPPGVARRRASLPSSGASASSGASSTAGGTVAHRSSSPGTSHNTTKKMKRPRSNHEAQHYASSSSIGRNLSRNIIETDSPYERFYTVCDGDAYKAAKKLASYWTLRENLFGQERAFLPMALPSNAASGKVSADVDELFCMDTALDQDVFDLLSYGALVQIPDQSHTGMSAFVMDRSKWPPWHSLPHAMPTKMKALFYILNVACENPITQKVGMTAMNFIYDCPDCQSHKNLMKMVTEVMPVRTMFYHLVFLPSRTGEYESMFDKLLDYMFEWLVAIRKDVTIHKGEDDDVVFKKLANCGFPKRSLPSWVGGTWNGFEVWISKRVKLEEERYLSKEEQLIRKRKRNALRVKEQRAKASVEIKQLKVQFVELRDKNVQLKQENQLLEDIYHNACTKIQQLE